MGVKLVSCTVFHSKKWEHQKDLDNKKINQNFKRSDITCGVKKDQNSESHFWLSMFFSTFWFLTFWFSTFWSFDVLIILKLLSMFWSFDNLIFDVPTPSHLYIGRREDHFEIGEIFYAPNITCLSNIVVFCLLATRFSLKDFKLANSKLFRSYLWLKIIRR